MYLPSFLILSATVARVASAPFHFPTSDGFPQISPASLAQIEHEAGGSVPNGPLPTNLKPTGITILQLLAHNELLEVAFFTQLLTNITSNIPGYDAAAITPLDRNYVVKALTTIVAQEKIHSLGANALLASGGEAPIAPCQYIFPVQNFAEALLFAETYTDTALGTIPSIQADFALDGGDEIPLIGLFSSVLGQEGEQIGFFRVAQHKKPSAAPQLTGGNPSFAFTVLQEFIVPDSCAVPVTNIPLTTFGKLNILTEPQARNMTLEFFIEGHVNCEHNSVVYISGINLPVTVPITGEMTTGNVTHFRALFPFEEGFSNGLMLALVVNGTGSFATYDVVAAATVYGPRLIEVN